MSVFRSRACKRASTRKLAIALWILSACSPDGGANQPADASGQPSDASTPQDAELDARGSDGTLPPMDALVADVSAPDATETDAGDARGDDAAFEEDASTLGTLIQTREGGGFSSLRVAGNRRGDVIAIWQQNDVSQVDRIWSANFSPLQGWSAPREIETHATGAFIIDLAIDDDGNAMAIWHEIEPPYDRSWANRFLPVAGWGTPARIEDLGADARASRVSLLADGSALVVGDAGSNLNRYAWSNRFTPSNGWGTATAFDTVNPALAPELSADSAGDAMAVWCSWDGMTQPKLIAHRFDAQTGWEAAQNVPISGGCIVPYISTVASGHYLALYHVWDGSFATLWGAPYRDGAWRTGTLVEDADKRAASLALPQVAVDGAGNTTVVWAGTSGLWAKAYVALDSAWGEAGLISSGTGTGYTLATFPANDVGDSLVVWFRGGDAKSPLFARHRPGSGGSFVDITLPVMQTSGVYKAVLESSAQLTSLWTTLEGTTSKLWATRTQLPR